MYCYVINKNQEDIKALPSNLFIPIRGLPDIEKAL